MSTKKNVSKCHPNGLTYSKSMALNIGTVRHDVELKEKKAKKKKDYNKFKVLKSLKIQNEFS